ncbi:MAG: DUF2807 domain-containing protein [Rikenellaceae bacterium]|nr:DUF2807 domain-containing protein [Rikenellaceae bacterium]
MKKIFSLVLALVMPVMMFAQETIVSRELPKFSKVELSGSLNVKFVRSSKNSFDLKLNGIGSDKLDWGVKKGKLYINLRGSSKTANADITIYYREMEELVAMSSNVEFENNTKLEMLDVKLQAGAYMKLNGTVGDLMLRATGNSNTDLDGECDYMSVTAVHSTVRASKLECIAVWVKASTGSEVMVNADERLEIDAVGASTVFYMGKPKYMRVSNTLNSTKNIVPLDQKK